MSRRKKRDVQLHAAVTVMPAVNNSVIVGEKDREIVQLAVQLDAAFAPFTRMQFEVAFRGLMERCLASARQAGILRDGE